MEEIKAYKISTGEIFDDKNKAVDAEKNATLEKEVFEFANRYGVYEEVEAIFNAIVNFKEELYDILDRYMNKTNQP